MLDLSHSDVVDALVRDLQSDGAHSEQLGLAFTGLSGLLLLRWFDAKDEAKQDESKDDTDDTHRVSQCVACSDVGTLRP